VAEFADSARLVRRLRIALVGVAMLFGLALIGVLGVLFYWNAYLLEGEGKDPFTRGPYVVGLSETTASVRFLGPDPERVEITAVAPDGTEVTAAAGDFTGLEPGTRYLWTAVVDAIGRASGSFQTAPADPDAEVVFGVIADYGSGSEHQYAVGRGLDAIDPAFVVTAGDNSYLLALPQLLDRNIFRPLRGVMGEAQLVVGLGDHDTFATDGRFLVEAVESPGDGLRYTYDYGPVRVVVLGVDEDPATIAYAEAELAKPWDGPRFAVLHTPPQPGDAINPILKGRVDAVFSGHLHRCERRVVDGVLVIVAGCGGQGPGDEAFTLESRDAAFSTLDYGFVRVTASRAGTAIETIDEAGRLRDRVEVPPR
jgi:predicted phosphodiesterase